MPAAMRSGRWWSLPDWSCHVANPRFLNSKLRVNDLACPELSQVAAGSVHCPKRTPLSRFSSSVFVLKLAAKASIDVLTNPDSACLCTDVCLPRTDVCLPHKPHVGNRNLRLRHLMTNCADLYYHWTVCRGQLNPTGYLSLSFKDRDTYELVCAGICPEWCSKRNTRSTVGAKQENTIPLQLYRETCLLGHQSNWTERTAWRTIPTCLLHTPRHHTNSTCFVGPQNG